MFDPTIYDNLRVVLEGGVYDLDLSGRIIIVRRKDMIDLACMSREYSISFKEKYGGKTYAEICLFAGLADLAAEILEVDGYYAGDVSETKMEYRQPGCRLEIRFKVPLKDPETEPQKMRETLKQIWDTRPDIIQRISHEIDARGQLSANRQIVNVLDFNRKIDENQLDDLENLLQYVMRSLRALNQLS